MNFHQRVFESYDRTKMLLKVREGFHHKKKLDHIQNRRSQRASPYKRSSSLGKYATNIGKCMNNNNGN